MLIILLVLLAMLSTYTLMQPTGLDFLHVRAFTVGTAPFRVLDVLIGLGILGVVAATRGPLAVAAGTLFVLWLKTLFGVNQAFGFDVSPLIVYVIVVGGVVQAVSRKPT